MKKTLQSIVNGNNKNNCLDISRKKKITLREKKAFLEIINDEGLEICKIKVDGCLIDNNSTKRCDYLLYCDYLAHNDNKLLLVELNYWWN